MLRAAGGYVKPSDDLRPRVMETVRTVRGERRARRRIGRFAILFLFVVLCANALGDQMQRLLTGPADSSRIVDANRIYSASESRVVGGHVDSGWGLVEAFVDLRCRQAESFRPAMRF